MVQDMHLDEHDHMSAPSPVGVQQRAMHDVTTWVAGGEAYLVAVLKEKQSARIEQREPQPVSWTDALYNTRRTDLTDLAASIENKLAVVPEVTLQTLRHVMLTTLGHTTKETTTVREAINRSGIIVATTLTWDGVTDDAYLHVWPTLQECAPDTCAQVDRNFNVEYGPRNSENPHGRQKEDGIDPAEDCRELAAAKALADVLARNDVELVFHTADAYLAFGAPHVLSTFGHDRPGDVRVVHYVSTGAGDKTPYWTYNIALADMLALRREDRKNRTGRRITVGGKNKNTIQNRAPTHSERHGR